MIIMQEIFINIDLFRYINEYTDLRSSCDTCVSFTTLKKYIKYKLNIDYSLIYYEDIAFRNIITSKIFNPYKQLHLDLNGCDNITDVSILDNVHTLDLSWCYGITDVSMPGKVYLLSVYGCNNQRFNACSYIKFE